VFRALVIIREFIYLHRFNDTVLFRSCPLQDPDEAMYKSRMISALNAASMLILDASEVRLPGEAKQNNLHDVSS
jgi:hypothetical protein